jgi:hypothetical protein
VDRIEDESIRLGCPDFADVLVWREATEGLEPSRKVVGGEEVCEVRPQLLVRLVVEPSDGRFLDRAVHPFDLAFRSWMVRFDQPVLDPVGFADHVEAHWPGLDGVPLARLLGELDAIDGQDGVDPVRHGLKHVLQELPGRLPVSRCNELHDGELGGSVYSDEQVWLAFGGLHLGNIDVEEPDGLPLQLLALELVAFGIWQSRDAMTLKAPMRR